MGTAVDRLCQLIDRFVEWTGQTVKWLALVVMSIMVYEVVARYIFNRPTVWAFDLSYMVGGSMMLLGAAYVLLHDGHVRVDLFYHKLKPRVKHGIDAVLSLVYFFPLHIVLLTYAFRYARRALLTGETSGVGIWEPSIAPFRIAVLVGFLLFLLEGISWWLRSVRGAVRRQE